MTSPDLPCPNQYKFSEGLDQDFGKASGVVTEYTFPPKICVLNPALYKVEDLTEAKDDYFPVVLIILTDYPKEYTGKAKKSLQITYGKFNFENGEYSFQ